MSIIDFKAVSYPLRLYSGKNALENLSSELKRNKSQRAFILCGKTVSRRTNLINRIRNILGASCAGVFDGIEKDSTLPSVLAATDEVRRANADLIIGVGGGSVIQATRVVAILLAENRTPYELMTQYKENSPPISPKLLAQKLPIINVLTVPTAAQNRGGSGVRNDDLDHRMEFFDPKTRPVAILWDSDALLTSPPELVRTAGCFIYWRSVMNLGCVELNPLVEGERLQSYNLAQRAIDKVEKLSDADFRVDLCAAAFLQNRDADEDGVSFGRHWVARVTYAFATALLIRNPKVSQGEAITALAGTMLRRLGARNEKAMARIGEVLGVWSESEPLAAASECVADYLDHRFSELGMPIRLRDLDIRRDDLDAVLESSLKNFNADPKREFLRDRQILEEILQSAW